MAKNSKPANKTGAKTPPPVRPAGRPPVKKAGKSIVNQKQFPWGWVATAVVLALAAGGIIWYAVANKKDPVNRYTAGEIAAAKDIQGVVYKDEPKHAHEQGVIEYDTTPPTGGNHSQYWADCSGTVYPNAIANENAVHALEHGAVWITYNKDKVTGAQLSTLKSLVEGRNYLLMSPYPDLKSAVSLQFWGYQLFVDKVDDPRIEDFINALVNNPDATPEYGVSCQNDDFKANPSTFGHPLWTSAPAAPAPSATTSP